ncbi:MAG: ATP-binding protein [Pseudomonadota bacterium]
MGSRQNGEQALFGSLDAEGQARVIEDLALSLPGAMFQYTLTPDGRDAVHYMSPGCKEIWEYAPEEIGEDPTRLWQTIHPDDLPAMQASVLHSKDTLTPWNHRWRIVTPSGVRKWVHGRGRPRRQANGDVLWNSIVLDVTEQMRAQIALEESRERFHQSRKIETIGKLTGGIAHDFNNFLAVIQGNLEIAAEKPHEEMTAACLSDALRATVNASELTAQLLSFSRRAPMERRALCVDKTLHALTTFLGRTLPRSVTMRFRPGSRAAHLCLDRAQLESAVLNLVLNARDAMPNGGVLTIETAAADGHVQIRIKDTGHGMTAAEKERALDPFFTTKPPGEGTGMGLSTVEGFVLQSGGTLNIATAPGDGTTVTLSFPVEDAQTGHVEEEMPEPAMNCGRDHILLVDDDDAVRLTLQRLLQSLGYAVTAMPDGTAALAFLERGERVSIVISDIVMPGEMEGTALAQEIRVREPDLPVILISGYPSSGRNAKVEEIAETFLPKPVSRAVLSAAVENALSASRQGVRDAL